jgi:hypothetical protein
MSQNVFPPEKQILKKQLGILNNRDYYFPTVLEAGRPRSRHSLEASPFDFWVAASPVPLPGHP